MTPRTAHAYLVVEDRRPNEWRLDGNAVISGCYQHKDAAMRAAAGKEARVLPIVVTLNDSFFVQPPVQITVPDDFAAAQATVPS